MALQWNDKLNVNVKILNSQHRRLIFLVSELHNFMCTGKPHDMLCKTLNSLSDYTVYHFREEERLMMLHGYQDYDLHKIEHDNFIIKLRECKKKYDAGRITVSIELMIFLMDWVNGHIIGTDKKYSQFFNDIGVM